MFDAKTVQAADLFGDRAIKGRVAGMNAGDVEAFGVRRLHLGNDFIQGHRGGVDDARLFRGLCDNVGGHQGSGVQHHRAGTYQVEAAHRDQVRRPRPGADEMNGHETGSIFAAYPRGV